MAEDSLATASLDAGHTTGGQTAFACCLPVASPSGIAVPAVSRSLGPRGASQPHTTPLQTQLLPESPQQRETTAMVSRGDRTADATTVAQRPSTPAAAGLCLQQHSGHDLLAWNGNSFDDVPGHLGQEPLYDFVVKKVVVVVFGSLSFVPLSLQDGWPDLPVDVRRISDKRLLSDLAGVAAQLHAWQGDAGLGYLVAAPLGRTFHSRGRWQATHREARRERLLRKSLAQLAGQLVEWRCVLALPGRSAYFHPAGTRCPSRVAAATPSAGANARDRSAQRRVDRRPSGRYRPRTRAFSGGCRTPPPSEPLEISAGGSHPRRLLRS